VTVAPVDILAVDGGNSKTDIVLVGRDGRLLAAGRGPTVSHQQVGLETGLTTFLRLVGAAADRARGVADHGALATDRGPVAEVGLYCLAGADFASDLRRLEAAYRRADASAEVMIMNDAFAGLRAGTSRPWGAAVVMGQGVNVAGIGRDGRRIHHAPGDPTSGDWGGGRDIGGQALAAAIRARDGRGTRTTLERALPAHFGLRRPGDVTRAVYEARIDDRRLSELAPVVFAEAMAGDAVARVIVDRTADEAAALALSVIRALRLVRTDVEVVLCGGIFRASDPAFHERIRARIHVVARRARVVVLRAPPVLGAALLGLDRLPIADRAEVEARLRTELTDERMAASRIG